MYFQQAAFTMTGLAIPAFERAWQRLVDRHPILRTSFHWEGREKPVQVVHRNLVMKVERLDWRAFPPAEQEARLTEFLREDRQRGLPYLKQGRVQRLELASGAEPDDQIAFIAAVQGSQLYEVKWTCLADGTWISDCSCPVGEARRVKSATSRGARRATARARLRRGWPW